MARSVAPGKGTENQKGRVAERTLTAGMAGMNRRSPLVNLVREASAQHIARQPGPAANARPRSISHAVGAGNDGCQAYLHGKPGVARPEDVLSL